MTTYTVIETNRNYVERTVGTYRTLKAAERAAREDARWAVSIVQAQELMPCGSARHPNPPYAIMGCARGCVTECAESTS